MIRVKGAGFIIQDIRVPVIRVPGRVCNAVRKRCHDMCTGYSMQCSHARFQGLGSKL